MANTKISALTANTNPNGGEELVYAYNNTNGKMTLNTMKTFASSDSQPMLVSGTNIKTINGDSILGSGNLVIEGGGGGGAGDVYDAVVDASGEGDYTLVSAAIAAGKYNIFVKNGSYTETAGWDPYANQTAFLRVIGESKNGVQITFPSTISLSNNVYLDMRYNNAANLYMENMSFDIALSSANWGFLRTGGGDLRINNCSFTYSGNTGTLLYFTTSDNLVVSNCDFISNTTSNVSIINEPLSFYGCTFKSTSGLINFSGGNDAYYLYNSKVDAYSFAGGDAHLYNGSVLNVSGGTLGAIQLEDVYDSEVHIGTLSSTPTSIEVAVANNSILDFGAYTVACGITNSYNNRGISNCRIVADTITSTPNMSGCVIRATTKLSLGSNATVTGCQLENQTLAVEMGSNNSVFMGNIARGNNGTVTISGNYNVVLGNNMPRFTITDTSTGSIKANNITAS